MGGRINPEEYCALKPILDQYPVSGDYCTGL